MRHRHAVAVTLLFLVSALFIATAPPGSAADKDAAAVEVTSLHGKVMCGYQGWFRCPGDASKLGWIHWSRDSKRIDPKTLTFEMWPDMSDYAKEERYAAPGFTHPDG